LFPNVGMELLKFQDRDNAAEKIMYIELLFFTFLHAICFILFNLSWVLDYTSGGSIERL